MLHPPRTRILDDEDNTPLSLENPTEWVVMSFKIAYFRRTYNYIQLNFASGPFQVLKIRISIRQLPIYTSKFQLMYRRIFCRKVNVSPNTNLC